jgi:hypothetical protein
VRIMGIAVQRILVGFVFCLAGNTPTAVLLGVLSWSTPCAAGVSVILLHADAAVQVKTVGRDIKPAPVPLALSEGQSIEIPEGAQARLLINGRPRTMHGPASVSTQAVGGAKGHRSDDSGILDSLGLTRQIGMAAGATRGGAVRPGQPVLLRPLPRSSALGISEIRWVCEACGEQKVRVIKMSTRSPLWRGTGLGRVTYSGRELAPGEYGIQLNGGPPSPFDVIGAEKAQRIESAAKTVNEGVVEPYQRLSAEVALWWLSDVKSEALRRLDAAILTYPEEPRFKTLRAQYEEGLDAHLRSPP